MTIYTTCGKQVLRNGENFAQACDNGAATLIADVLNSRKGCLVPYERDNLTYVRVRPYVPRNQRDMCRAYQASDQMICPCGLQWDVNDPDPPRCRD